MFPPSLIVYTGDWVFLCPAGVSARVRCVFSSDFAENKKGVQPKIDEKELKKKKKRTNEHRLMNHYR